jgi:hypothetical protein
MTSYRILTLDNFFEYADIDIVRELNNPEFTIKDIYEAYDAFLVIKIQHKEIL